MSFERFNLDLKIMSGVRALGYTSPTSIQLDSIPPIQGNDVSVGTRLVPIDVKHGATLGAGDFSSLHAFLDDHPKATQYGILISHYPRVERVSRRIFNIPLGLVLNGRQLSL